MHYAAKDEIFCLLLSGQQAKRDDAGVDLLFWVFVRPVLPALIYLLLHPALVAGLRASIRFAQVELDTLDGTGFLPLGCVFPCWLGVVAQGLAVGSVDLVAGGGDGDGGVVDHA